MNYLYSHPLISFTVIILVPLLLQHHSTTALTPLPPTINAQQHNNNWTLSEQVKNYTHAPVNYKLSYIHSVLHQHKTKPKGKDELIKVAVANIIVSQMSIIMKNMPTPSMK